MDIERASAEMRAFSADIIEAVGTCCLYAGTYYFAGNTYQAIEGAFREDVPLHNVLQSAGNAAFFAAIFGTVVGIGYGLERIRNRGDTDGQT